MTHKIAFKSRDVKNTFFPQIIPQITIYLLFISFTKWDQDYIFPLAWECLGIPQEEMEGVAGAKDVWVSLLSLMPPQPTR